MYMHTCAYTMYINAHAPIVILFVTTIAFTVSVTKIYDITRTYIHAYIIIIYANAITQAGIHIMQYTQKKTDILNTIGY